jgi:hypothetical protein
MNEIEKCTLYPFDPKSCEAEALATPAKYEA